MTGVPGANRGRRSHPLRTDSSSGNIGGANRCSLGASVMSDGERPVSLSIQIWTSSSVVVSGYLARSALTAVNHLKGEVLDTHHLVGDPLSEDIGVHRLLSVDALG